MKYYIDYEQETGKILGFLIENNISYKEGEVIEVDLNTYNTAMGFNKIIINGEKITFEDVPIIARTPEEIEKERKQNIYFQISILESKTYRPLREQLVGTEEEKLQASTILGELDEQIKALRSQL